jgi:hypothetical protein
MSQLIIDARFEAEKEAALQLAADSDILDLTAFGRRKFIATLRCTTFIGNPAEGPIGTTDRVVVGIRLPEDYLSRPPNPAHLLTCLEPLDLWHPNVAPPFICIGHVRAGESLIDIIYRTFEVVSFQNYATLEHDCLRREACAWARKNAQLFPADARPLKRRNLEPDVQPIAPIAPVAQA